MRTSRPIYQNGFVMEFSVKKSLIHYKIFAWNKDATNQSLLQEGVLGDQDARQVFNNALQSFSTVSRT